jgi:hypothetical protein
LRKFTDFLRKAKSFGRNAIKAFTGPGEVIRIAMLHLEEAD